MKKRAMRIRLAQVFLSVVVAAGLAASAYADVSLPSVIGDNMVLQRGQPIPIWGWDAPGTRVTVTLQGNRAEATADAAGKWMVQLPALEAGGPFTLSVSGSTDVQIKNVLCGEVWICSGQSNMAFPVAAARNAGEEIAAADFPQIRHIKIPPVAAESPRQNVPSTGWRECKPETVGSFTAVGYFFGRCLHQELNVPIGLIGSNWGGTRIEPWTPPVGFEQVPALKSIAEKLADFPVKDAKGNVNHQSPLALYNGMIHPLVPYGVRGAIWYQGESNNGEGMLYYEKMKALIGGWRSVWDNENLSFYFVQLAPYTYGGNPEALPGIWEAQQRTLSIPGTGMAVTVDIGNVKDIHPKNKQDVGKRLALWALAKNYGCKSLVYSGPLYRSMQIEGSKIRIAFEHAASGLVARDGQPLNWFTIAGKDGKFTAATATIDGETVLVEAAGVAEPVAVRFGWDQNAEPNLANKEGLPAAPFRTDNEGQEQADNS